MSREYFASLPNPERHSAMVLIPSSDVTEAALATILQAMFRRKVHVALHITDSSISVNDFIAFFDLLLVLSGPTMNQDHGKLMLIQFVNCKHLGEGPTLLEMLETIKAKCEAKDYHMTARYYEGGMGMKFEWTT
jgi:hypothetical protein